MMTRPRYETDEDRKNQQAAADRIASVMGWHLEHVGGQRIDLWAYDTPEHDNLLCVIEYKNRRHHKGVYHTVILSHHKWECGVNTGRHYAVPFWLVVEWQCGTMGVLQQLPASGYEPRVQQDGGRTVQTRDAHDVEPVVHLPVYMFKTLDQARTSWSRTQPVQQVFSFPTAPDDARTTRT